MTKPQHQGPSQLDLWFRPLLIAAVLAVGAFKFLFRWNSAVAVAAAVSTLALGVAVAFVMTRRLRLEQKDFQASLDAKREQ